MMLQTHNNNFDDSNLTKTVLLTIISQISNFPILLWENKFPRPKKKSRETTVITCVTTCFDENFSALLDGGAAPHPGGT